MKVIISDPNERPDPEPEEQHGEEQDRLEVDPPQNPMPNARRFVAARFNHHVRRLLVHQGGAFYRWDGSCWPEIEDAALVEQIYKYFENAVWIKETKDGSEVVPFAPNRYKVSDLIDALRAVAFEPVTTPSPSWLDDDGPAPANEIVACENGLVHWPSRTLYPLTPRFYIHHAVPFAYDPDAPAPQRWLTFLKDLWPDDPEAIGTLQEIFGYVISGDTSQHKIFMLVGPKRGGKGTIGRLLTALVGAHNVAGLTLASLNDRFGLEQLIGKPLGIVADARIRTSSTDVVTERLLSVSGEDPFTIDRKYKAHWSGFLPTRFLVLTNELPRIADSSGALASRFVVLTLTRTFYGQEDTALTDDLLTELPGIFNWALDGLERLRERGRFEIPSSSADTIRELEDLGSPMGAFVRDRCAVGPEQQIACDELYQAWRSWCQDQGRDRPGTIQSFGRDLRAVLPHIQVTRPRRDDGVQVRTYAGVALCDHNRECSHDNGGEGRDSPRLSTVRRDESRTQPPLSQDLDGGDRDDLEGGDPPCNGCGDPADRTSSAGTTWCQPCWDEAAGGAA